MTNPRKIAAAVHVLVKTRFMYSRIRFLEIISHHNTQRQLREIPLEYSRVKGQECRKKLIG